MAENVARGNWGTLFQQATDATFLLNPRRRLRYVNPAWEALVGFAAEAVVHEYCLPTKFTKQLPAGVRALLQTMAPPKDVLRGQIVTVRRPVPPIRHGPPWWDITFMPLRDGEKLLGILGIIRASGGLPLPAGTKGLSEALTNLRERAYRRCTLQHFFGETPAWQRLRTQAELAASTKAPVWINAPAGAGKETLARGIHAHGITREGAFLVIDGAGLQPYLVRSLLFGHNGLAETGRLGTVYLKAPEALPVDVQIELAEWHEIVDDPPRFIVGVRPDAQLAPALRQRFGVLELTLPSLHERTAEMPRWLEEAHPAGATPEVLHVLQAWPWANNFREWGMVLRDAGQRANGNRLEVEHLSLAMRRHEAAQRGAPLAPKATVTATLDTVLEQVERRMIELALKKCRGDQTAAAALLDVHRSRLVRRISALGLNNDR